jgi:MerR family transcriptional regulator/heat shock protein HspR
MSSDKPVFTISVAAKLLRLHPRTLMLYEKSQLINPHRTDTNRRLFSLNDIEELQFIKYLTRKQGVNLQGVRFIQQSIEEGAKHGIRLKNILFPAFQPRKLV